MRLRKMMVFAMGMLAMMPMTGGLAGMTRADSVDDYLKSEMARRHIPGMTVAVVQNGKVVKEQGYGLADMELSVPATPDTVYMLASISKQFTAVGVMLLVREGKVGWTTRSASISQVCPSPGAVSLSVNCSTRLPASRSGSRTRTKTRLLKTYTLAEIARRAASKPLAFEPGRGYRYSNTNYNLLAGIIEKAGGKPYGEFLRARIFDPLGMKATGVYDSEAIVKNRASGYVRVGGKLFNNILVYDPSYLAGAGGLQSTAGDLVRWDAALDAGTVLPQSSLAQMWTPPALPGGAHTSYGMGWLNQTIHEHRLIWHNGSLPGTMGFVGRFPQDHLTVIILSNMSPLDGFDDASPFLPLGRGVAALYVTALAKADTPILDTEPPVTQMLRQVLTSLAANRADTSHLTPDMTAALTPAVIAQTNHNLAPLGAFQPDSLALTSRASENGLRVYRYHAKYGKTPVIWTVHLTMDSKIAGMVPQADE